MYRFYNDVCFFIEIFFLFFFVFFITVWDIKTVSIYFNSTLFDGKVNLVGAFRSSKFKFTIVFESAGKNKIKIEEKR